MAPITVREAAESDLAVVLRLLDQIDESMYPRQPAASEAALPDLLRQVRQDPNQHLLVAETGGRAVGTAHLYVLQHFERHPKRSAVVEGVVVDPAYRGKGVGAALMREAASLARRHGCYKLTLTSNLARSGAHRFYSRLGWKRSHYGYSLEL